MKGDKGVTRLNQKCLIKKKEGGGGLANKEGTMRTSWDQIGPNLYYLTPHMHAYE
jgi:hypothetical protein